MAAQYSRQFPTQIVGIGHTCVAATGAKGVHNFGSVAHEKHAAHAQGVEALALVGVGSHPDNVDLHFFAKLAL